MSGAKVRGDRARLTDRSGGYVVFQSFNRDLGVAGENLG